ncbi:MAG: GAP family protein, partial [Mycobacterium sp.]
MWGTLLGIALFMSLNPLLLGVILLVISRPRPLQNLFAFWVGAVTVNIPAFVIPLLLLHLNPTWASRAEDLSRPAPGSTVQPLETGVGVLMLLVAAAMIMRSRVRARQPSNPPPPRGGNPSVTVLDSDKPTALSRALSRIQETRFVSAIRRLFSRARNAWESGSVWVSVLFGLGYVAPPPTILL